MRTAARIAPRMRPLALALALLALTPALPASARTVILNEPADFGVLFATPGDEESVVTSVGGDAGRYFWQHGTFMPLVDLAPFTRFVASPDGEWIARRHLTQEEGTGNFLDELHATRVSTNETTILRAGEMRSFAAGGDLLAATFAGSGAIHLWRWGEWDAPIELVEPRAPRFHPLAVSPDARWIAAVDAQANRVLVFNASGLREIAALLPARDSVAGLAFSPDGDSLAVLTTQTGRFSELRVVRVTDDALAPVATARWGDAGAALAWGAPGVAVLHHHHLTEYEPARDLAVRLLRPDAGLEERARFDAANASGSAVAFVGVHLLVGSQDGLRVIDTTTGAALHSTPGAPAQRIAPVEVAQPPSPSPSVHGDPPPPPPPRATPLAPWAAFAAAAMVAAVSAAPSRGRRPPRA